MKDDKDLEEGPNISWSMDPKTRIASLMIGKATVEDSGKYSCVAYSESGGHASTTSDVQVLCNGPHYIVFSIILIDNIIEGC